MLLEARHFGLEDMARLLEKEEAKRKNGVKGGAGKAKGEKAVQAPIELVSLF